MRLLVARCAIDYSGRLTTHLAEATRLLMIKADGTFMVFSDHGSQSVKPLNWMTPPTVIEESGTPPTRLLVRKHGSGGEERLEISITEVLSDVSHEMGSPAADVALAKDGIEAHLQELLAAAPQWCGEGLRLVRREWPTDIGPVDLMCRDEAAAWVAVEVKRVAGIDAVEQPLPDPDPAGPGVRRLPRCAGGPGHQAPGPRARGCARDRLRRVRPCRAAR